MLDMVEVMQENRPQRITSAQAAHVVDIVSGIQTASREGRPVQNTSEFPQPAPWIEQNSDTCEREKRCLM